MRMGLHEANQRVSKAVRAVKAGQDVILTERGKPIAVLKPLGESSRPEVVIRQMETSGRLRASAKPVPLPPWAPRPIRGAPLSRTIREERDAS